MAAKNKPDDLNNEENKNGITINIESSERVKNEHGIKLQELVYEKQNKTDGSFIKENKNGVAISVDSSERGKSDIGIKLQGFESQNGDSNSSNLLGVPRSGHRKSIMEEESAKERLRVALLKQCSAILKQGDQRYNKDSLHRVLQDEDLLDRIFRLFDVERLGHLTQEDWIEFLKERLSEDKQLAFVEQCESAAYVLCGEGGLITPNHFHSIFGNRLVSDRLFRVLDTDGDGYCTGDDVMEFLSAVTTSRPRVGFDKFSVHRLEELFKETVGDQKEITREQFQKIVVSKNPFFTERVFQIFDEDDSGTISLQEFIAAAHSFAGQAPDQKMRFLFKVYDLDGDGLIQHRELQHVMRACMEENGMQFSEDQLHELTSAMFEDADTEDRGAITYEALKNQLEKHEGLLENLSISIDRWLVPPKPEEAPTSLRHRIMKHKPHQFTKQYFRNNQVFVGYLAVFFILNISLFISRVVEYRDHNGFVMVARGCGQCLNFNCSWILALMLRHTITWARARGLGSLLPLDQHIYLHKLTGVLVACFSVLHTAMHLCNFSILVVNDPVINAKNYTLYEWLLTERPGVYGLVGGCANPTGVALVFVILIMYYCSQPHVRRGGSFEVFYWTHLLYVPFWLLLIFHAPNFWKWFVIPGLMYVIERVVRLTWMRSERGKTYISSGILLPSRVTHLVVKRPPHFDFRAGDYVFVNIPAIASYEWHPFTISSAPEQEEHIWLHIRGVGEWTNRLYSYFESQQAVLHARTSKSLGHDILTRTTSNQSNKSKLQMKEVKKRSVDFSPTPQYSPSAYSNEGFSVEDEKVFRATSPLALPASSQTNLLAVPLKLPLEKSLSMPDMQTKVKKKQRLIALRDYMRSESEKSFDECSVRRANFRALGLAYKSPQNKQLAHSFRYMRNKPTIIAFKTPSMESCERGNLLTVARRRLSKSISPDKDTEAVHSENHNVSNGSTGEEFANFPVGKPLENTVRPMPTRQYVRFLSTDHRQETPELPKVLGHTEIYLDGPYGAASSHIFRAEHAALVAAGIGVTPFASILQCIMRRYWQARNECPKCKHTWLSDKVQACMTLKKVDFFWINREQRSFEWFVSLLSQLEMEQAELGARFLDMHMYITSALQRSDMKAVGLQLALDLLHEKEKRDLITGLKTRTNAGRPNWDKVFQQLQAQRRGRVTVFYCGPSQLAKTLKLKCDEFGFQFRKEVF